MTFFDELKRNAKTAADATKKKTGELTAIAKATMAVKSEESRMSESYKEIGRLFYEAERDGVDNTESIASYIMQIDKNKACIAALKKEIAVLKKVIICENCSNEISNSFIFCPICGTKLPKEEVPAAGEECCCCEDSCCEAENDTECCCEENSAEECCCNEEEPSEEEKAE